MTMLMLLALALQAPASVSPAVPGTVTVEFAADDRTPDAIREVTAEAVEQALLSAGFTALPAPGRGRYVARIMLGRTAVGQVATKPDHGASSRVGLGGLIVALPSGAQEFRDLAATELDIDLIERGTASLVWSGKAKTVQVDGTRAGSPQALAAKLAGALLATFPAMSAEPIAVP